MFHPVHAIRRNGSPSRQRPIVGALACATLAAGTLAIGSSPAAAQSEPVPPSVFIVNGFTTGQYDFYIDGELSRGGVEPLRRSGMLQKTPSTGDPFSEGTYQIDVYDKEAGPNSSSPSPAVASKSITVCEARSYSLAVHPDASGAPTLSLFENDQREPGPDSTRITVRHIGQAGAADIEIGSNGENSGPATNASFTVSNGEERVVENAIVQDYQIDAFASGTTELVTSNPDAEGEANSPLVAYIMGSPPETTPPGEFLPTYLIPVPQNTEAPAPAPAGSRCGSDASNGSDQTPTTSAFNPIDPTRVLDTRTGDGALADGESITIDPSSIADFPADATAIVVNLTAAQTVGTGFLSATAVEPTDAPTTSSVNWGEGDGNVAATATVPLSTNGTFNVYVGGGAQVIADVTGFFTPTETATSGRFTAIDPERALDTRSSGTTSTLQADEQVTVDIDGETGVPTDDVSAVALNVTAVNADAGGYVTVVAGDTTVDLTATSSVNFDAGQTIANQVVVPVDQAVDIALASSSDTDLVIDVYGYFTSDAGAESSAGLYVPATPERAVDTRSSGAIDAETSITIDASIALDVDETEVSAVNTTIAVVQPVAKTFATVYPTGTARPDTSVVNAEAGVNRANSAYVKVANGEFDVWSFASTDAVVDVSGYFTG